MLFGCYVLGQVPLIWKGKKRVLLWGNAPYVVDDIPKQKSGVSRDPVEIFKPSKTFSQIHLLHQEKPPPYQTHFESVMVNQTPDTTLVVHPQPRFSHSSYPFLVQVISDNHTHIPLTNSSKGDKILRLEPLWDLVKRQN